MEATETFCQKVTKIGFENRRKSLQISKADICLMSYLLLILRRLQRTAANRTPNHFLRVRGGWGAVVRQWTTSRPTRKGRAGQTH
jgi:hypothetical protein